MPPGQNCCRLVLSPSFGDTSRNHRMMHTGTLHHREQTLSNHIMRCGFVFAAAPATLCHSVATEKHGVQHGTRTLS